jgi:hypothetical protein
MPDPIIKKYIRNNFLYDDKAKCYRLITKTKKSGTIKLANIRGTKKNNL